MKFGETLIDLRKRNGLTQEELAAKLYVTRQAVSRWERGEVTPGIDMLKLIANVLNEPVAHLLDWPEHYCESCGMMLAPEEYGTDAHGSADSHYCKWCYQQGEYTYETTMDAMIEDCAPRLAESTGMTRDEAVSLMGAVLPHLKRWSAVHSNEMRYGVEARERYGDAAKKAMLTGDASSPEAVKLARMHADWIRMQWAEGAYSPQAHVCLARGYLADDRFVEYYDSRAGKGATELLVEAIEAALG